MNGWKIFGMIMASVFGLPFAVGFIVVSMCFVVRLIIAMCDETETSRSQPPSRRQESSGSHAASEDQQPSPQLVIPIANPTRPYTYEEMKAATNGFSDANLLGQGGFGIVYKGALEGMDVAIKKLKPGSSQGDREFRAEIDIISRVHHKNLASLVGFCSDGDQRLLAYEFVPNNTLEFHLHGSDQPTLDWSRRWTIALTSAKGLAYLHDDCQPKIIHRDIKAANILLDMNFEAKVADFGLARFQPAPITHVSTRVMGTFGYLAPEYATTGRLTSKSDVFSFGVVLLELITGREPIQSPQSNVNAILIDWARPLLKRACEENIYNGLVDPRLQNKFDRDQMTRLIKCAAEAVRYSADDRPTMSQIYHCLEGGNAVEDPKSGATPGQSSSNVSGQGRNRNTF